MAFLSESGTNTWQYILDVVMALVDPAAGRPAIETLDRQLVNLSSVPVAGAYVCRHSGTLKRSNLFCRLIRGLYRSIAAHRLRCQSVL